MIELTNISKFYKMGDETVHALQDVSLTINDGEYVAIIGPSGSGKSTLMNILGCLDIPSAGEYRLNGKLVSKLQESQLATVRNKNIGLVFQNFNLLGKATALRNVELPARYGGVGATERHKMAVEAMTSVGLANRLGHKPTELSGGQQQRVAIARALMNHPNILLADEPTGALDSKTGKEILDLFEQLQREKNITVIVVTHDPNVARRAHRVITIRDGRIESDISRQPGAKDVAIPVVAHEMAIPAGAAVSSVPVYQETLPEHGTAASDGVTAADEPQAPAAPRRATLGRIAVMGVLAAIIAAIVNVALGQLEGLVFGVRGPMSSVMLVAEYTIIGVLLATLVFAIVNRLAPNPARLFRIIAVVALVLSFTPDIGLATGLFNPLALLGGGRGGGGAAAADGGANGATTGGQTGGGFRGPAVRGAGGGGLAGGLLAGAGATGGGGGNRGFRNQSPVATAGSLMALHVAAALIAVSLLTRSQKKRTITSKVRGVA